MSERGVPHSWEEGPTIMTDAFSDRTRQHVVGPRSRPRVAVWRDIWSDQSGISLRSIVVSRTFLARQRRSSGRVPVTLGMAPEAAKNALDQISTASQPRRTWLKRSTSQRTAPRTEHQPPCCWIESPIEEEARRKNGAENQQGHYADPHPASANPPHIAPDSSKHGTTDRAQSASSRQLPFADSWR